MTARSKSSTSAELYARSMLPTDAFGEAQTAKAETVITIPVSFPVIISQPLPPGMGRLRR